MSSVSYRKIAIAMASLGFAAGALAQSSGFGPPTRDAEDRLFIEQAAQGGLAEIELGKLAQKRASSDAVKQFGARMAEDHSKANDELKKLAASRNITLASTPDRKTQQELADLGKTKRFDHEYMELMVSDHRKDVAEFRKQAQATKSSDVKAFAQKTLPTLEDHLKQAEATKAALK
jgi:putative membrane protein